MKQCTLTTVGFGVGAKRTHKRVFLDEMNVVVPWSEQVSLNQPMPKAVK